jgi:hypothetical protein
MYKYHTFQQKHIKADSGSVMRDRKFCQGRWAFGLLLTNRSLDPFNSYSTSLKVQSDL